MYYLFILGKILVLLFPRNICYFIARWLAILHFYISKNDREAVIYNLSPIIDEENKLKLCAKNVFINFAYYLADFFQHGRLNRAFIEKYVKITGLENLHQSFLEKKGVITLTAHLGNYELGGAITSILGYPINAVALAHKDERTNKFFNKQREVAGVGVIQTGVAVKKCFSLLKKGEIVAFLADRDFSGIGTRSKIFSRYAYLPKGPAFFALKTNAHIIPSFFVREKKKNYHLIFDKPIICDKEGLKSEEEIIQRYTPILEKYIKKYPDQWYMFERYWLEEKVESNE